uniref:Uncharacterized protein n=1 Tax=Cacopsylla melanoneura TaxID=428564 RepID=A0A8D8T147_9HEMI
MKLLKLSQRNTLEGEGNIMMIGNGNLATQGNLLSVHYLLLFTFFFHPGNGSPTAVYVFLFPLLLSSVLSFAPMTSSFSFSFTSSSPAPMHSFLLLSTAFPVSVSLQSYLSLLLYVSITPSLSSPFFSPFPFLLLYLLLLLLLLKIIILSPVIFAEYYLHFIISF